MWYDETRRVEVWYIPRQTASKRVPYLLQTCPVERPSALHQTVLVTFLGFRNSLYSCTEGMCHSSTRPGTSYHMTQFYQAFPRVSTASNKRWGEKAWVQGYSYSPECTSAGLMPLQSCATYRVWRGWTESPCILPVIILLGENCSP